jgi:hypothetical protein
MRADKIRAGMHVEDYVVTDVEGSIGFVWALVVGVSHTDGGNTVRITYEDGAVGVATADCDLRAREER